MRFIAIAVAAGFCFAVGAPAQAHHGKAVEHQELAQAKKSKKSAKPRVRKEQYLRAVPSK